MERKEAWKRDRKEGRKKEGKEGRRDRKSRKGTCESQESQIGRYMTLGKAVSSRKT